MTPLLELERWLVKKIGPRPPGMPYSQWVKKIDPLVDAQLLTEAISLHNQLRYDPAEPTAEAENRLREICGMVRKRG